MFSRAQKYLCSAYPLFYFECVHYYSRQDRAVYGCAMTKAFDMVEWSDLFDTLRKRGVSAISLRLLLFIYQNQQCNVRWAGKVSQGFLVNNGVRQGAVSSAILFSVYIDELFTILRHSGFGCYVSGIFLGCFGYADDLFLISASRTGLQAMVKLCQQFAERKNLKFSTNSNPFKSKTKCIIFSKKLKERVPIKPVQLEGKPLPWVPQIKHLGSMLQGDNSMKVDLSQKRGTFIGRMN